MKTPGRYLSAPATVLYEFILLPGRDLILLMSKPTYSDNSHYDYQSLTKLQNVQTQFGALKKLRMYASTFIACYPSPIKRLITFPLFVL